MDLQRHRFLIIFSAIAILLQIIIAPNIQLGNAEPNFITSFVIAYVLIHAEEPHYILAFTMGLIADLLGSTSFGLTSLCLILASFAVSSVALMIGNDNLLMSILTILVALLCVDLIYALFLVGFGLVSFGDAMLFRVLPCTLYDATIGIIWYFVLVRFGASGGTLRGTGRGGVTNIRFN
ncbi:MAG: rod shape-determining protein MreD [Eggerthellaceae bacterium]|jgi:rod shape-determining protein MreD